MDCQKALTNLADMSAESLEAPAAQELMRHLEECPECEVEWEAFQRTIYRLSVAPQPLPSPEQSRCIWAACLEEISRDVEAKRQAPSGDSGLSRFFNVAPRWSWALLGGAAAVFGAAYAMAPHAPHAGAISPSTQLAGFETPPAMFSPLVNHHAAFAFDALNDHTTTSLLSMGSTAPRPSNSNAPAAATHAVSTPSSP